MPKMTVKKALEFADEWTRGREFEDGTAGWRMVCKVLAEEVRGHRPDLVKKGINNEIDNWENFASIEAGLPELKGSWKQKEWAEQIRNNFLEFCRNSHTLSHKEARKFFSITASHFWIEARFNLEEINDPADIGELYRQLKHLVK